MSIDIENKENKDRNREPGKNKALAGMILLLVGMVFLVHKLNIILFPYWIFDGWMILIIFGLYIGAKHNFRNIAWLILVVIGGLNLLEDIFPKASFNDAIFPIIIIAIGIRLIINRNKPWNRDRWNKEQWKEQWKGQWDWRNHAGPKPGEEQGDIPKEEKGFDYKTFYGDDYLDATSVFSGVKKKVLSKDFKGGDITNFFGGCDVDFTSADISGRVVIDVTQVFGGIKLIVPPHWHVTSDMVSLFAGFDDKRLQKSDYGSDKILVLKGTSIFAGVEIRSY
ncbi:hypothetical protein BEL04_17715 [Mucilaginibacter sp. PPCGB 2223]|uniref:LiaF transmembrane domain-containing protein n=1 Tax=Mucilaginibacter sp. PPCGB 2223 TaxID=1886027 RepID=UPI000824D7F0|nr:LiaF domain-containing protein [Mucilaginibacter sp. PPCGB 2223]OCX51848.1 hypothetical protein BEL04_17715 [Mucilaginibacter sp. PPCGB 2223]